MHLVTIGLLQNQVRNVKERIGPAGQSDLPRQRFHSFFLWNQINIELDRWGDRLATLLVTTPASLTRVASLASLPGRTSTAALPAFARSALAILIAAGRTVPSLVRRTAAFAPAFAFLSFAFELGVLVFRGRSLRPRRQKMQIQIQLQFGRSGLVRCAHTTVLCESSAKTRTVK